jgi:hypothetical protein
MKTKLTFILFFSLGFFFPRKKDSIKPKYKYEPNLAIGVDVLNAACLLLVIENYFKHMLLQK